MDKIVIVGNDQSKDIANKYNANVIELKFENDYDVISDFVTTNLSQDFDVLLIDADRFPKPDVALAIGMYMRLSVLDIRENALKPIIVASDKSIKSYLHFKPYSQLLMTKNVYFQPRTEIMFDCVLPLASKDYVNDFLSFINIKPEQGRNHSLANQWGASVIDKISNNGTNTNFIEFKKAERSLFFKYVHLQTINIVDYLLNKISPPNLNNRKKIEALGKRILLIDDEADKGWEYVLRNLVNIEKDDFLVIKHPIKNFDSLPPQEKKMILSGNFDLIILDLRLNGENEDDIYDPQRFSGMSLLKNIKKESPGTQVIMLTASNKAWNIKALSQKADGYYVKESPEYGFSLSFSAKNYDVLHEEIEFCLNRSYLRNVDRIISNIKKDFNQTQNNKPQFKNGIKNLIDISYTLLYSRHYAFAFISLYQVIELVNDEYLEIAKNKRWFIKETGDYAKSWMINIKHECVEANMTKDDKRKFPEWKKLSSIYYQLWKQKDKKFGYNAQKLIKRRNDFMHNDIKSDSFSEKDYIELIELINIVCSQIL